MSNPLDCLSIRTETVGKHWGGEYFEIEVAMLAFAPEIEILSFVLEGARIQGRLLCHKVFRGAWGLSFPDRPGARFHLVTRGQCWLNHPNLPEPRLLHPGDLVFLGRSGAHELVGVPGNRVVDVESLISGEPWNPADVGNIPREATDAYLICGEFSWVSERFPSLLQALPPVLTLSGRGGNPPDFLAPLLEVLASEGRRSAPGRSTVVSRLLEALLVLILRQALEGPIPVESAVWLRALGDPSLSRVVAAIHTEPDRRWTLEELGGVAHQSRAAFCRKFSEAFGLSPMKYLAWWRLELAKTLLQEWALGLEQVAQRCGYQTTYSFSKAFKKAHGQPPGQYRVAHASRRPGNAPLRPPASTTLPGPAKRRP